jgi:hypothetical protein
VSDTSVIPSLLRKQAIIDFLAGSGVPTDLWDESEFLDLVTRIYLRSNEEFKRQILPPDEDIKGRQRTLKPRDPKVIAIYWRQMLPEYIWVAELGKRSDIDITNPSKRKIIGEMLLDPTAHRDAIPSTLLALHLNGRMVYRESPPGNPERGALLRDHRPIKFVTDLDRTPYDPLYRKFYP